MGAYLIANGPMQTTSAFAPVTTGTSIKTLLQLKPFNTCEIVEWGISFDGTTSNTPIKVELIDTGTIFGTVTAHVDADITKYSSVEDAVASIAGLTLATNGTGYTCTNEGSIAAVRNFDIQLVAPTNQYVKQFPLGERPKCIIGNAVRVRVTASTAVNAYTYIIVRF